MNLYSRDEVLALHKQGEVSNGVKALKCLNLFSNCLMEVKDNQVKRFHVYLASSPERMQGFLDEAKAADIPVLTYPADKARELVLGRLQCKKID